MKTSELAKWFNAVADAWNRGEAPWAYPDGTSEAIRVWNRLGDEGLVAWAVEHGITLKRRRKPTQEKP